ncbi:MAG: NAD(P)-binding domain-containing protein [Methanomicrobiales archaeon]
MKIGFIGFGEVSSTLAKGLLDEGLEVSTCIVGRSSRTVIMAEKTGVNLLNSNNELADESDILISAAVPSQAEDVAKDIGKNFKGIYVDLNNVSPQTVRNCLKYFNNSRLVDASIIGSIRQGLKTLIIASGSHADEFAKLNDYGMNIKVIGDKVGQASTIKLLRSSFTKGISAILFETLFSAYKMGLDEEVLDYISITEGPNFKDSAKSRIISSAYHSKRRLQELEEINNYLSNLNNPLLNQATLKFYENLEKNLEQLESRPHDYKQIFAKLSRNKSKKK